MRFHATISLLIYMELDNLLCSVRNVMKQIFVGQKGSICDIFSACVAIAKATPVMFVEWSGGGG